MKAAAAYDQALKLLPPSSSALAGELHRERAACFMAVKQFGDAVVDTTRALASNPKDATALYYRAMAYRELGNQKKSLADAAVCAALAVGDDAKQQASVEMSKKIIAGAKQASGPAGLGGLNLAPTKPTAKKEETPQEQYQRKLLEQRALQQLRERQKQQAWGPPVSVKASVGDDTRIVIVPSMISHKDLMTSLSKKFPDVGEGFTVMYTDEDGALKPLTSRVDFAAAFVVAQKEKETGGDAKPTLHQLPSLKLTIVEQGAEPMQVEDAKDASEDNQIAPNEVVEIDEWILDFAALFREHLGIDAEAHLDLHAEVRLFCLFTDRAHPKPPPPPSAAMTKTYTTTPNSIDERVANVFRSYREPLRIFLFS